MSALLKTYFLYHVHQLYQFDPELKANIDFFVHFNYLRNSEFHSKMSHLREILNTATVSGETNN